MARRTMALTDGAPDRDVDENDAGWVPVSQDVSSPWLTPGVGVTAPHGITWLSHSPNRLAL
jgi:hypothetical protein